MGNIRGLTARVVAVGVLATGVPVALAGQAHADGPTGRLAFESDRDGDFDVYVADPDGSNPVNVTNSAGDDLDPVWSPDGSTLVFMSTRDGDHEIYSVGADGSGLARLTTDAATDTTPSWSPDGTRIAYAHGDSTRTIWTMNADGTGKAAVPNAPATAGSPVFSPDGGKLAFVAWPAGSYSGNSDVYTINVDGTGLTKVTDSACAAFHPKWSPDGSQLAFDRACGASGSSLAVAPAVGGPVVTVPGVSGWAYSPAWLPDAFTLVFARAESDFSNADVYSIRLDGTQLTQLTNSSGWDDDATVDTGSGVSLPDPTSLSLSAAPQSGGTSSPTMLRTATVLRPRTTSVRLGGRLSSMGRPLARQRVTLYARRPGSTGAWTLVATTRTDWLGRMAFVHRPTRSTEYVVMYTTTPAYGTSVSAARMVTV
jgi:TolB protein